MNIFHPLKGGSKELDIGEMAEILEFMLIPGESIRRAYQVGDEVIVFTDRRLLKANRRGATRKRTEFRTVPYKSILDFEKEIAGRGDFRVTIGIAGGKDDLELSFDDDTTAVDFYRELSKLVLR